MNVCNDFYIVKKKDIPQNSVKAYKCINHFWPISLTLYSHRKQLTILYLKLLIIYNWSIKIYKVVISMNYTVLYSIIYPVNMHWKGLDSQEDVYIYVLIRWNLLSVSVESWNDIQFKWNIRNHLIEKKNCDFNYILLCYSKRKNGILYINISDWSIAIYVVYCSILLSVSWLSYYCIRNYYEIN